MGRAARVALTGLLAVAAVPAVAPAGSGPARLWADGRISALGPLRITVHGKTHDLTCRIGPLAPKKFGYLRGGHAVITCEQGLLVRIAGPHGTAAVAVAGNGGSTASASSSTSSSQSGSSSSSSSSASANGRSEFDFVGPIGSVSASSISFGSYSCKVGSGSPAVGAYHPGDRVHAHCSDGVLTSIASA